MSNVATQLEQIISLARVKADEEKLPLTELAVDVKLVIHGVDLGDIEVILSADEAGVVLHLPKEVKGYYEEEYELTYEKKVKEVTISAIEAIEVRKKIQEIIEELELMITWSTNQEMSAEVLSEIKTLRRNAVQRLEVLENKLRALQV